MSLKTISIIAVFLGFGLCDYFLSLQGPSYGYLKISDDSTHVVFSFQERTQSRNALYVVDLNSNSWILIQNAKHSLYSPIWSKDGRHILSVAQSTNLNQKAIFKIVKIDFTTQATQVLFQFEGPIGRLSRHPDSDDFIFSLNTRCISNPSEFCGMTNELHYFKFEDQSTHQLTNIRGNFSPPQIENEHSIIVDIPVIHESSKSCGIKDNFIYRLNFPSPLTVSQKPLEGKCDWRPIIDGDAVFANGPLLSKSKEGTLLYYIKQDRSNPGKWSTSLMQRHLQTETDRTVVTNITISQQETFDISRDGRTLVQVFNKTFNGPILKIKDMNSAAEKELTPLKKIRVDTIEID